MTLTANSWIEFPSYWVSTLHSHQCILKIVREFLKLTNILHLLKSRVAIINAGAWIFRVIKSVLGDNYILLLKTKQKVLKKLQHIYYVSTKSNTSRQIVLKRWLTCV